MNENPLISIVTVVYNDAKGLEKTIQNVVGQSYSNVEYIIIDGGSTDDTIDVIKQYENNIDYWVSEPDNGIYDAMNKGLKKATGDWINFMNVGDCFSSESSLVNYANYFNNKIAIVFSDVMIIDEDGGKSYSKQSGLFKKQIFLNQMPHQAIFFNAEQTQNMLYNTNFKVAADLDLLVRIYLKYGDDAFKHIEEPLVHYALGGYSAQNYSSLVEERYQVILNLPIKLSVINKLNHYRQRIFAKQS